jgi:hypothetical protein
VQEVSRGDLRDHLELLHRRRPTRRWQRGGVALAALSVAITSLLHNTGGSLFLAVLMHSAINQTKDLVTAVLPGAHSPLSLTGSLAAWLTVAALWICAGYFLRRMSLPGSRAGHPAFTRHG